MALDFILSAFAVLSLLCLVLMITYLRLTEREAQHVPAVSLDAPDKASEGMPLVSVIVTARNEEDKIGNCLSTLVTQTYKNLEIIVVDDSSTDETKEVASEFSKGDARVKVVEAGEKPKDWIGKSWACNVGFLLSNGKLLLFVDADSTFEPKTIEIAVSHFQRSSLDMFSISARVNLEGMWSKSTLPLVSAGINLLYPMKKVNDKRSKRAYVFGTFILVSRNTYESIGGHEKVREKIVEDAALAQLAKSHGYKLEIMVGDGLVKTDWESDFSAVYHGMERVFSDSVRPYGLISLLDAVLIYFLGLYPLFFIAGIFGYSFFDRNFLTGFGSSVIIAGLVASFLCVVLALAIMANELKLVREKIGLAPFLYPLGFFLFMSAIVTSTLKISLSRGFHWKGQEYK